MKLLKLLADKNFSEPKSKKGFTLIEILIVLGIVVLLISMTAIIGFDAIGRSNVSSERDLIVTLLVGARAKALANIKEKAHGVYIDSNNLVLFYGNSYNPSDPNNNVIKRNSAISIEPNPFEFSFEQLSGNTAAGSFTLSAGQQSAEIKINQWGRIEW